MLQLPVIFSLAGLLDPNPAPSVEPPPTEATVQQAPEPDQALPGEGSAADASADASIEARLDARATPEPRRGTGMMIAGGILVGSSAALRAGVLWGAATVPCGAEGLDCVFTRASLVGSTVPLSTIMVGTGMGLAGAGAARRGQWLAWNDARQGRSTKLPRARLGWALFGSGLGLWFGTRFALTALVADSSKSAVIGAVAAEEVGWYVGLPLAATGLALALRSRAYQRFNPLYRLGAESLSVSFAPSRHGMSVGLTGKF